MNRSDFLFWLFGLLFIYLGIAGSFNETAAYAVYYAYPWQASVGLVLLTLSGIGLLFAPSYIEMIQKEARL